MPGLADREHGMLPGPLPQRRVCHGRAGAADDYSASRVLHDEHRIPLAQPEVQRNGDRQAMRPPRSSLARQPCGEHLLANDAGADQIIDPLRLIA
jgi:hypothetical protein